MYYFYNLYSHLIENYQQVADDSEHGNLLHVVEVSKTKNHQRCVDESIE